MTAASVVRTIGDMEGLRDEWACLASIAPSPLLDHDWFMSCAEAFGHEDRLRVVVVREGAMLAGIAPMALEPTVVGPRLVLIGATSLYEPSGWLYASRTALESLVDEVLLMRRPVLLHRVPAESDLIAVLTGRTQSKAVTMVRPSAPSLGVSLQGSWEDYYCSLSRRVTENLPRLRRKAARDVGAVEFTTRAITPSEVGTMLQGVVAIEGSGWKGRNGSSLSKRPQLGTFFSRYCQRAAAQGRLRLSTLTFGSRVGAVEVAVEAYARLWQLKIGYDETLAPYYPGLHLTEFCIKHAFERGLNSYEFLGSAEAWEYRWKPQLRAYNLLASYPMNAAGFVGVCRDMVRSAIGRVSDLSAEGRGAE